MGLQLQTQHYYNNGGGLNLKYSPTKCPESQASLSLNVSYSIDGAFATRNGSTIMNVSGVPPIPNQIPGAPKTLLLHHYTNSIGTDIKLVCAGTNIYSGLVAPTSVVSGISGLLPYPDIEDFVTNDDEYAIWGNGINENLKFNGTTWTNLSLPRPAAPTAIDNGAGALGAGQYTYYYSYARTVTGVIVQESELSPAGSVTIGAGRQTQVTLSVCSESLLTGVTAQCNARVLYRISPTSSGIPYRLATIADNVTTIYNDNSLADGVIEAEDDNQTTPKSKVFEENYGKLVSVDAAQPTDYLVSKAYKPWISPETSRTILDAPIVCIKRAFSVLIIGTTKSIWVINGDPETAAPRRVSSAVGILNNRCAISQDTGILSILATNNKIYPLTATDFSQNEIRFSDPLSLYIEPLLAQMNLTQTEIPCMADYTTADVSQIILSAPFSVSTNNRLIIYNDTQSLLNKDACWEVHDNINASALKQMTIGGVQNLYSGDYNGFLWKLDDNSIYGDGSEDNGTVTSATGTTLTDSTKTWVVNEHVGKIVRLIGGYGVDQSQTIISNTATTLTVAVLSPVPNTTTTYTIGGYDAYHYSNWKSVLNSYDALKQLWYIGYNVNASGNYPIKMIVQFDFDQSISGQSEVEINLRSGNAVWGSFIWGAAIWGAQEVFQDRESVGGRFRAIRVGFLNRQAGQPFQVNGFSISAQDKGLLYRSAS